MSQSAPHPGPDSCATLQLEDGVLVIYNPKKPSSWLQSDVTLRLDDAR